jgi:anti-repressor protein
MNQLIPIKYDNERQTVSGRSLHEFLEVDTRYNDWFPRMCEYGFAEGTDFYSFLSNGEGFGKAATRTDHQLTIEMAKELCMLQRTEKGKQARQYFIELEKQWNSPEAVFARALKMADAKILSLQSSVQIKDEQIAALTPKAQSFDTFMSAEGNLTIEETAKTLNIVGVGRNNLFKVLVTVGVLFRKGESYEAYQRYVDAGYFVHKQNPVKMGAKIEQRTQVFVTAKGLDWLARKLAAEGYRVDKQMALV